MVRLKLSTGTYSKKVFSFLVSSNLVGFSHKKGNIATVDMKIPREKGGESVKKGANATAEEVQRT